jgi:hypothetical protein
LGFYEGLKIKVGFRGDDMVLSIATVLDLKKRVEEVSSNRLHFHDACGGQSFSFDSKCSAELTELIAEYFKEIGAEVCFSEDGMGFVVI